MIPTASLRTPLIAATTTLLLLTAGHAVEIFSDSFESPVVLNSSGDDPDGWSAPGHPDYFRIANENDNNATWSTPYGQQGISTYSNGFATKTVTFIEQPDIPYELLFNITSNSAMGEYRAEIWTRDEGTQVETLRAYVTGDTDGSKNMSYSDSVLWVSTAETVGHQLIIKLGQDPLRRNWRHTPIWDNVRVETVLPSPYELWANGAQFDGDNNQDGFDNGLAWMLGAPDSYVWMPVHLRPVAYYESPIEDIFTMFSFRRIQEAEDEGVIYSIQYSTDLVNWVDAVDDGYDILITEIPEWYGTGVHAVDLEINRALLPGGQVWFRISAQLPPAP